MYLTKNFRNYIPLIAMLIVMAFLGFYLNVFMYNLPDWTQMLVIILPFIVVPIINVVHTVLNTHKLKRGKNLYISIVFSYVLQLLPVLILMINTDDKGMGIIQSYLTFLLCFDVLTFIYPWKIYHSNKE